jgi:hypothetical protein
MEAFLNGGAALNPPRLQRAVDFRRNPWSEPAARANQSELVRAPATHESGTRHPPGQFEPRGDTAPT